MRRTALALVLVFSWLLAAAPVSAQSRFLGREEIVVLGAGLRVEPAHQTVPKDLATIVSTFLQAPAAPDAPPPFSPDAVVKATLRGPSFAGPLFVSTRPNTPFNIPPLTVPGVHTLEEIRIEENGQVLLRAVPESVTIDVIERLLVTHVTARALTAQEIKEKGLVFDKSSFQAYNFTAAFAVGDANPVPLSFPVLLPQFTVADVGQTGATVPGVLPPQLPNLKTIIPDTLQLQAQIPNLAVVGFTLRVVALEDKQLVVPPIPGIIVIPGDIGFLNQVFKVTLLVGNVAPPASGLVVSSLTAEILVPPGRDGVANSPDDPLRMARTAAGETPRVQLVVQAGGDGKIGTADDIATLGPGHTGAAEYLVEGRREGTHALEMEMTGTLSGLPGGAVEIRGRAAGAVLVRNPTFTLAFTHPELVNAGEPYTLDVTVTNTSESPANFVTLSLFPQNVIGATIIGSSSQQIESIAPGDSDTVSFTLDPLVTGPVTAATLESDSNIEGRFALKTSVGELGVPLSPDSLILPAETGDLPDSIRKAALGLLGKAWAVATAPAAALPPNVTRFTREIIYARAIQLAEAGMRVRLGDSLDETAFQLAFDYAGNNYARIPSERPPAEVPYAQADFHGFDDLRRQSRRGDIWAHALAGVLSPSLESVGATAFHAKLAASGSWRPAHISVMIAAAGPLPYRLSLIDAAGRRVGGVDENGKVIKQIPFADLLTFADGTAAPHAELALLASPDLADYTIRLDRVTGAAALPFTLSLVFPQQDGTLRHVAFESVAPGSQPSLTFPANAPVRLTITRFAGGMSEAAGVAISPTRSDTVQQPALAAVGAVQMAAADVFICPTTGEVLEAGRVIAVLFNKEVTREAVMDQVEAPDLTRFMVDGNQVLSVALQPQRRIAYLALRDPIGPLVSRTVTVNGVPDAEGAPLFQTLPIEMTVAPTAGRVTGQVLNADGTPVPFAEVRMFYHWCEFVYGISAKAADAEGRFSFDYVLRYVDSVRIVAIHPGTGDNRRVMFGVQRDGQQLHVNVVFLGRGSLVGRVLNEAGVPQPRARLRAVALVDQSSYGATADDQGRYAFDGLPVGSLVIDAVNADRNAKAVISEYMPAAGAVVTRDVVLFSAASVPVETKFGALKGYVLRADGQQPVAGVPVIAYYKHNSQPNIFCPATQDGPPPHECAVATVNTDGNGFFELPQVPAGHLRVVTFDEVTSQQGEAFVHVEPDQTFQFNIVLAKGLGTVRGVVLDDTGAPVANARVGGGLSITTTNGAGQFVLTDVPLGHREIVAVSDALAKKGSAFVDLLVVGAEVQVTIVLKPSSSVAGVVRTATGQAVANIKVYLFKPAVCVGSECIDVIGQAVTNQAGQYSIANVPLGNNYTLSAFRSDFSDGNLKPIVLKFGNEVVDGNITFRGRGRITGTAFDDDGVTPLKATVGVSGDQLKVAGGLVGTAFVHVRNFQIVETHFTTGAFAFNDIWTGDFTLQAAGQFSPDPIAFAGEIPGPGQVVDVQLRLQPTSRIIGRILQPDGVTPVGANVIVRYQSRAYKVVCASSLECEIIPQGVQQFSAITDPQGQYLIEPINAGPFTLSVEDPATGRVAQVAGEMRPGQTGEYNIRLLGRSDVRIRVRGSNGTSPIPHARVQVVQIGFPSHTVDATADANGELLLAGGNAFMEGELFVKATDLSNGFAGRATGKIPAGDSPVTIDVFLFNARGTVTGVVRKSDGLTPVANAEVILRNAQGPLGFALSDVNGTFSIDNVPLGEFEVQSFEAATGREGFASGRVDLDGQNVPVTITQLAIGMVTGTLMQGGTLAPLKAWEVSLQMYTSSGALLRALRTTTGVDGRFAFPGASLGKFRLDAFKVGQIGRGYVIGELTHEGHTVDVPFVITIPRKAFGRIEGTVYLPNGTPAANAQIVLKEHADLPPRGVTADTEGRFVFDHIEIGRVRLEAEKPGVPGRAAFNAELLFEGDVLRIAITLVGTGRITGTVYEGDGVTPVPFAPVRLEGEPATGCGAGNAPCQAAANAQGRFEFNSVPLRSFNVSATHPINGLQGAAGDVLHPGETKDVRIVLQPSSSITGRIVYADGDPAIGAVAELTLSPAPNLRQIFAVTDDTGFFTMAAIPIGGPFDLLLRDPLGPGRARRVVTTTGGTIALGTITLDEAPPAVVATTPAASAVAVPRNQQVRVVFSEAITGASATAEHIVLLDESGPVPALLDLVDGDTAVAITPLSQLADQRKYTISVHGVVDRLGQAMTAPFAASFTTVDILAPQILESNPAPSANGVPVYTPIRVKYNEPIDPSRFTGAAIAMQSAGTATAGQLDFAFGNTTIIFTPSKPLLDDTIYTVTIAAATDLSGNAQPAGTTFTFRTTDRSAPQISALVAAGNGTVIAGATTSIVPQLPPTHDVAFVDYYVNDVLTASAQQPPFAFTLLAAPIFGGPGTVLKISALATDTSGNRGQTPAVVMVPIVADAPPVVTITSPAAGVSAPNGQRIEVTVQVTDDVGISQVAFTAATGVPTDAATKAIAPPVTARTETFAFSIPAQTAPGSTITITASALDTQGHVATAAVGVTVLDATAPNVSITGTTSGTRVIPGQATQVVVSAQDAGGVKQITFSAEGAIVTSEVRNISPPSTSLATSFTLTAPANLVTGAAITLRAEAVDAAGNTRMSSPVILTIADQNPPTLTLRTASGRAEAAAGQALVVIANAQDETAVQRVDFQAFGAVTVTHSSAVSPPATSAEVTFNLPVPSGVAPGQTITLQATARDVFSNISAPATLAVTVKALADVTLPPSVLAFAGDTVDVPVQLTAPAPQGGLSIAFALANPTYATVTSAVTIPEGQTSTTISLLAKSGGTTVLTASIQGVPRATSTVTVRGGVVRGTVLTETGAPVAGALLNVKGRRIVTTTSDANGEYFVDDIVEGFVGSWPITAKALDPNTRLQGFASGTLVNNGMVRLNVVLVPAATVFGTVFLHDGETPAGGGVAVELYAGSAAGQPAATVFTEDDGRFEFPLIPIGTYQLEAHAADGNAGRASTAVLESGTDVTVNVQFLGRGTVNGVVRAGGTPVPNAEVTFTQQVLKATNKIVKTTAPDGSFQFDNVYVGEFTLSARDAISNQAGTVSGSVDTHQQVVTKEIALGQWSSLTGRVLRPDRVTPVSGASVRAFISTATTSVFVGPTPTNPDGSYNLPFLPLGSYTLVASENGTRSKGQATGTLTTHATTKTQDIVLNGTGALFVTVINGAGTPVPGAKVTIDSATGYLYTSFTALTGADGTVLVDDVMAASFNARATALSLGSNYVSGVLQDGELEHITLTLEPAGSIAGVVYAPDGQTPVASAFVGLSNYNYEAYSKMPVNADATYRFDNLRVGPTPYKVTVFDAQNRRRAVAKNILIGQQGEVQTRNLVMVGLGTIRGRVLNPDGSSAGGQFVTLQTLAPDIGGYRSAITDAAGFFLFEDAIAGPFIVSSTNYTLGFRAEHAGVLPAHGDDVTADLLLSASTTTLPLQRFDANNFPYSIQPGGNTAGSGVAGYSDAFFLDVVSASGTERFSNATAFGVLEENGRELALADSLAGLNVTRKIYVPRSYFTRYLEILSNPTGSPITVDVAIGALYPSIGTREIDRTSSGDQTLDVTSATPDTWATIRTSSVEDPDVTVSASTIAHVFDGVGGARRAATASFDGSPKSFRYRWNNVTIQPGETMAFMHFGAQQYNLTAARASADRLSQLPPEALDGLSPLEIAAMQNFAVPADGSSTVDALPALTGTVSGRVVEADGVTGVPNAQVTFRSSNVLFGRAQQRSADNAGSFQFVTAFNELGSSVVVPVTDFTLSAKFPDSDAVSPVFNGHFSDGETVAALDVPFTNTATIAGTVRRHNGLVVTAGTVTVGKNDPLVFVGPLIIAGDGTYRAPGLPPGTYSVFARVATPPGVEQPYTQLVGSASATVAAGQVKAVDVAIQGTGTVTGTLRHVNGAVVANALVELFTTNFNRVARTSSGGIFLFTDVPAGTYTLRATNPQNGVRTVASVTVVVDQTTVRDLSLLASGTLEVTATYPNGAIVSGAQVKIQDADDSSFRSVGTTNALGMLSIPNVAAGNYTLQVVHPRNISAIGQTTGSLDSEISGALVTVPALGSVEVTVTFASGAPAPNALTGVKFGTLAGFAQDGPTNAAGTRTFTNVYGPFTIRAFHPSFAGFVVSKEVTGAVFVDNGLTQISLVLQPTGTLSGQVRRTDGTPVASANVTIYRDEGGNSGAFTNAQGFYSATLLTGYFDAVVERSNPSLAGSAEGRIDNDGQTVQADIVLDGVVLPTTLTDANLIGYQILSNGQNGSPNLQSFWRYGMNVTPAGGTTQFFSGRTAADLELSGRQVEIRQHRFAGLLATRKVYVPADGYFERYLEVFENRGTAPVTFQVTLSGENFAATQGTVLSTSSGDSALDANDTWLVTGVAAQTQRSFRVVAGAGAVRPMSSAGVTFTAEVRWADITLGPGEKIGFLHLVGFSNTTNVSAVVTRLAQLPPEAVAGLTEEERAIIANFAVPAESTLDPFPTITGHVYDIDGVTPIGGATVTLQSPNPFVTVQGTTVTTAAGQFTFKYPALKSFTLQAKHPLTNALSSAVTGLIAPGQLSVVKDIVFTTIGTLRGEVRVDGVLTTSGEVKLTNGLVTLTAPIGADGRYQFTGVQSGSYTITATTAGLTSVAQLIGIPGGQVTERNIAISTKIGTLKVSVYAADDATQIRTATVVRAYDVQTGALLGADSVPDTLGIYQFNNIAHGTMGMRVVASVTTGGRTIDTEIAAAFTFTNQVLELRIATALSLVRVNVTTPEGAVANASIAAYQDVSGVLRSFAPFIQHTAGSVTIVGIEVGPFTVRVNELGRLRVIESTHTMTDVAVPMVIDLVLPVAGSIFGVVLDSVGKPVPFASVTVTSTGSALGHSVDVTADEFGTYVVPSVPLGAFTVHACSVGGDVVCADASGTIAAAGEAVEVNLTLPPLAMAAGVLQSGGTTGSMRRRMGRDLNSEVI